MTYFFDSSALAKVYHQEVGSELVTDLYTSEDDIFIADISRLEFISSLMRRMREGKLSFTASNVVAELFAWDITHRFKLVPLSTGIVDRAQRLMLEHGWRHNLRSLDALQFASYTIGAKDESIFVCADRRLAELAQALGRVVCNPDPK